MNNHAVMEPSVRKFLHRLCGPGDDGFCRDGYRVRYDFGADVWRFAIDPAMQLLELEDAECLALLRGFRQVLTRMRRRVDRALAGSTMFFRLSSRSGKDVAGGIRATCFDDVVRACASSERLREDLELHVADASGDERMYLVLRPWLDIVTEHRVFVVGRRPLCASSCGPEPTEVSVDPFASECSRILERLPHVDCAIDFATTADGSTVALEVNPL